MTTSSRPPLPVKPVVPPPSAPATTTVPVVPPLPTSAPVVTPGSQTPTPSLSTDAGAENWLSRWPARGDSVNNSILTAADVSLAAGVLGVPASSVHVLFSGSVESTTAFVAAAVCSSCQAQGGVPVAKVVAFEGGPFAGGSFGGSLDGGSFTGASLLLQAPVGPGLGIFPVQSANGWSLAVAEGPDVASAQVQTASGGQWQVVGMNGGVGTVDSLPDPTTTVSVRLYDSTGNQVGDQSVGQWTQISSGLNGSAESRDFPGFGSASGSGNSGGSGSHNH